MLRFESSIDDRDLTRLKRGVIPPPVRIYGITRFDVEKTLEAFRAAGEAQK